MLKIRAEQIAALNQDAMNAFKAKLATKLRGDFEDRVKAVDDLELSDLLDRLIAKGKSYAVSKECDLKQFVIYAASYDWDFPQNQLWASAVLQEEHSDGSAKMRKLEAAEMEAIRNGQV